MKSPGPGEVVMFFLTRCAHVGNLHGVTGNPGYDVARKEVCGFRDSEIPTIPTRALARFSRQSSLEYVDYLVCLGA